MLKIKSYRYCIIAALFLLLYSACQEDNNESPIKTDKSANQGPLFSLVPTDQSGVTFTNSLQESVKRMFYNFNPIYDGGGVSLGDINNDGLTDIYFTGNEVSNKLYLNKGNMQFEDITEKAGVGGGPGWHNGANMVDINGDGLLDIYVCRGGWRKEENLRANLLFINQGDLTFKEMAGKYGLYDKGYSFQSNFFDYDNDGDLDVYVINHPAKSGIDIPEYQQGRKSGSKFSKDRLYQNNGNNTFSDITEKVGLGETFGFGLSVTTADLDGNDFLDIYVTNDYTERDYLFMNNGDGTFTDKVHDMMKHISLFAMGTDIADFNNDGLEDVFVTEMLPEDYKRSKTMMANMNPQRFEKLVSEGFHHQYMHNSLQLNRGNGHFSEVSQLAGLSKTDWSWACFLSDFDNDGLRDAFVSNGYKRDVYDKDSAKKRQKYLKENNDNIPNIDEFLKLTPVTKSVNYIFKNEDGYHFKKKIEEWGFDKPSFSNGAAVADLDNDGDLDIVVNNFDEPAFIYENSASLNGRNYLRIKLKGPEKNPHGIGAKITVLYGKEKQFEQFKMTRGYLSSVEPISHFGLGDVSKIDKVVVTWHDGKQTIISDIETNQVLEVAYTNAGGSNLPSTSNPNTLMVEKTDAYFPQPFIHKENKHNDYRAQVLLPHKLSQLGPFSATADVNGDQLEDIFIGGANGQAGQIFLQEKSGRFLPKPNGAFVNDKGFEDMGAVFFDADGDGDKDLYIVSGGTEKPINDPYYADRIYLNDGLGSFSRAKISQELRSSGSCVVVNDFDKDGDPDLFIGGRSIPDVYPVAPFSHILRNDGGIYRDVTDEIGPEIRKAGMVTSALWEDINQDGQTDLILVGEWMPIRVYTQSNGKFKEATSQFGFENSVGWWNKIIANDIDNDGDIDFVLGNLGLNYKFKASPEKPFHVYCQDFDQNGTFDVMLAKYYGEKQVPVRGRQCSSEQMPFIADKFPTYSAFADADINEVIGENIEKAIHYEATEFASLILRNNGGQFEKEYLPIESQISTVNAIVVEDFDGDQVKDILIGGNMYQSEAETTRADASIGLLLKGNSDGTYNSTSVLKSGFFIPFDVKDMSLIKLANDKKGVLVTANNDMMRIFEIQ